MKRFPKQIYVYRESEGYLVICDEGLGSLEAPEVLATYQLVAESDLVVDRRLIERKQKRKKKLV